MGSKLGNLVTDGTEVELFKFRSLIGFIVFHSGGQLYWKTVQQVHTTLSYCKEEVMATIEATKETMYLRLRAQELSLEYAKNTTPVFNDNRGCVDWSKATTKKGTKHLNLRGHYIHKIQADKTIFVLHVSVTSNPIYIFTKEIKYGSHFRLLCNSFMSTRDKIDRPTRLAPLRIQPPRRLTPAAARTTFNND